MTAQIPEKLIIEGKESFMTFCPPLPDDLGIITQLTREEFLEGRKSGQINQIVGSTACWRGYIGTWEIKDGKFYLKKLEGRVRLTKEEPVFFDWFSGVLRIPQGKMLHYVHMGFGSIYEQELYIRIEKGVVVDQYTVDTAENAPKHGLKEFFIEGLCNFIFP